MNHTAVTAAPAPSARPLLAASTAADEYVSPAKLVAVLNLLFDLQVSEKTLANWRSASKGPAFIKVGRVVRYRLTDIHTWATRAERGGRR